jgi:hypothetical protein
VINPRWSVWPVLHLALRQVIVTKGGSVPHSKQIHYVFGRIPGGSDPVSLPSTLSPKYVVVDEIAGRAVPTHPVVTGAANHSRPWEFTAFVPSHDLSIIVTTNAARSQVRRIGSRMLVSAAGGKA